VPAHTRDDIHVAGDSYEQFIKNNWGSLENSFKANFVAVNSLDQAFDSLANYSNNNFYSDDTTKSYSKPDNKLLKKKYIKVGQGDYPFWVEQGSENIYVCRDLNTGFNINGSQKNNCEINDKFVLTGYSQHLLPKAVGYSAGVIKLFFTKVDEVDYKNLSWLKLNSKGLVDTFVGKVTATGIALGSKISSLWNNIFGGSASDKVVAGETESLKSQPLVTSNQELVISKQATVTSKPVIVTSNQQIVTSKPTEPTNKPLANSLEPIVVVEQQKPVVIEPIPVVIPQVPVIQTPAVLPVKITPIVYYGGGGGGGGGGNTNHDTHNTTQTNNTTQDNQNTSSTTTEQQTTTTTEQQPDTTPPPAPVLNESFNKIIYTTNTAWNITGTVSTDTAKILVYYSSVPQSSAEPKYSFVSEGVNFSYLAELVEGSNYFSFTALDEKNNTSTLSEPAQIVVDNFAPAVPELFLTNPSSTNINISVSSTDNYSGTFFDLEYKKSLPEEEWVSLYSNTTTKEFNFRALRGQAYEFRARAKDEVGNVSEWSEIKSSPFFDYIILDGEQTEETLNLTAEDSPYILKNYSVPVGKTLIVEPGTVIKSWYYTSVLNIYGNLNSLGSSDNPIIFTSGRDTAFTNIQFSKSLGTWDRYDPGDWQGLWLRDGSKTDIKNTEIRSAGYQFRIASLGPSDPSIEQVITAENAELKLENVKFLNNNGTIIQASNGLTSINNSDFIGGNVAMVANSVDLSISNTNFSGFKYTYYTIFAGNKFPNFDNVTITESVANWAMLNSVATNNDQHLTKGAAAVMVFNGLTVPEQTTLYVDAGAVIRLAAYSNVNINGNLIANGEAEQIKIIPLDRTWGQMFFNSSTSKLTNVYITGGNNHPGNDMGTDGAVFAKNSNLEFTNVIIENTRRPWISLRTENCTLNYNGGRVGDSNKTISRWGSYGIQFDGKGDLYLSNIEFSNLWLGLVGNDPAIFHPDRDTITFSNVDWKVAWTGWTF